MAEKPSLPKGTRDFGVMEMRRRAYILDIIRKQFELHGFQPIETPAMENLSVLTGKYGDEGDQLLYKIINSGDYLKKTTADDYQKGSGFLLPKISEKGLRYDLTVPFARYVALNHHELTFPFKRYQIQPVWRADRPQKGRYREFLQCDMDTVGTDALFCEAEYLSVITRVFSELGIQQYEILINSRKILQGVANVLNIPDRLTELATAIDKWDKIGEEGVYNELIERGISEDGITKLKRLFENDGLDDWEAQLEEEGRRGIYEIREIFSYFEMLQEPPHKVRFDPHLARGLTYYTGAIIEVKPLGVKMGSIGGGGRYDDLTGMFGLNNMSGVGFSFGIDRIYDVMEESGLFDDVIAHPADVLILNFGKTSLDASMAILNRLRESGIRSEFYPEEIKIKKQLNYANKKDIPFVIFPGEEELASGKVNLKNFRSGMQEEIEIEEIIEVVKKLSGNLTR